MCDRVANVKEARSEVIRRQRVRASRAVEAAALRAGAPLSSMGPWQEHHQSNELKS